MSYKVKRIIRKIRPEFVSELFYEHDLKNIPNKQPNIQVALQLLNNKNVSRIREVRKMSLNRLKNRLANGDQCFVTEIDGRLASYHWIQVKGNHYVQQTGKWEKVEEGDAVIYHVLVHPDFRGNRINGYVYSEILKYCKAQGLKRVWIYTNKKNRSNRKGLEQLGFKKYKQTLSLKINNKYYQLKEKLFMS